MTGVDRITAEELASIERAFLAGKNRMGRFEDLIDEIRLLWSELAKAEEEVRRLSDLCTAMADELGQVMERSE